MYLFPIFNFSPKLKAVMLVALLISGHLISKAVFPSKTAMFMESVSFDKRGSFTAVKEMISLVGGIVISLGMGRIADVFRSQDGLPTREYYVICSIALLLMALIHTVSVASATEKPKKEIERVAFKDTVKRISKNKNFVKVIAVGLIWNVASALSVSFFASYLREELAFSFTVIAFISTVGSVARIIVSPLMGKLADKYSFATSMTVAFSIAGFGFLAVVFTTPKTRWLYLAYTCLNGFAMAGINSGLINCIYDYMPGEDRATALGVKNALGGILAFFTALISGSVMSAIQKRGGLKILGMNLYAQQVLAFLSLVAVIILIVYMRLVIAPLQRRE
jgi:MFS family permease